MNIEDLINLCIVELERQGIKIGTALEDLKKNHNKISKIRELLSKFRTSKNSVVYEYESSSSEEKAKFRDMINGVLNNDVQTEEVINEMTNLFFLQKEGLIDLDEVAPQREKIDRTLDSLINTMQAYVERFDIKNYEKNVQGLSNEMDRIIGLGTILSTLHDNDRSAIISDTSFFKSVVEHLEVSEEEKNKLIVFAINHNNAIYERELRKRKDKLKSELEGIQEKVAEEIDISRHVATLPQSVLDEIEDYLSDPKVIEKIVRIINDDYKAVINFKSLTAEQKELIEESLSLAKETIIATLQENSHLNPYEALQIFYDEYDLTRKNKTEELRNILKSTNRSTLSEKNQQLIIRQSYQFVEQNKEAMQTLTQIQKDMIRKHMQENYSDYKNRIRIYKSKLYDDASNLKKEAAYEIGYLLDLLESLDSNEDDAEDLMSRAATRLEEIFKSLYTIINEEENKKEERQDSEKGTLFFLMKNEDKSVLEDEINFQSSNKGISPTYYSDIKNQLLAIEDREKAPLTSNLVYAKDLKLAKKLATRYTSGKRTQVLFIPYGKSDAIIVYANFISGRSSYKDGLEDVLKRNKAQIDELRERLDNPETYKEEVEKAKKQREKIFNALDNYQEESINDQIAKMLEPQAGEEEPMSKKKR